MPHDSRFLGVSVRGWITVLIVSTVCGMSACKITVEEPLYSLVNMAVGFYLGQKISRTNGPGAQP